MLIMVEVDEGVEEEEDMEPGMGLYYGMWVLAVIGLIAAGVAGVGLVDVAIHEHAQTITVAEVGRYSVMDSSGNVWELHLNEFQMRDIQPGDELTLAWRGGDWIPNRSKTPYVVVGSLNVSGGTGA